MIEIGKNNTLSPKVIKFFFIRLALPILLLFFLSLFLINVSIKLFLFILFLILFLSFFIFLYLFLYIKNFSFLIDEEKIIVKSGIILKQQNSIPLDKIQNIKVTQNIFQRFFNVATIKIWTASPAQIKYTNTSEKVSNVISAPDILLELEKEDADFLLKFLLNKKNKNL